MMYYTRFSSLVFAGLVAACGTEGTPAAPAPVADPLPTSTPAPPAATAPVRSVYQRNPLGNALAADNLFADGDFELTGRTGQMPWLAYANMAQGTLDYDTGGRCRSGVRCGVLGKNQSLIAFVASPPKENFFVSVYVKPQSGNCAEVRAYVADELLGASSSMLKAPKEPDETGWCLFAGTVFNMANLNPALFVEFVGAPASKRALVDEGVALPISQMKKAGPRIQEALYPAPITEPTPMHARAILQDIRARRIYGLPSKHLLDYPAPTSER